MTRQADPKLHTWRDPADLGQLVVWGIYARIAAIAVRLGMVLFSIVDISRLKLSEPGLPYLANNRQMPIDLALSLISLVAGYFFLKWTYRISRNAHAGSSPLQTPPAWAVGWYFVPVLNLWKPIKALCEIWRVSADPAHPSRVRIPIILIVYWALVATKGVIHIAISATAMVWNTMQALLIFQFIQVISLLISILSAFLLIRIVRQLTALQTETLAPIARRDEALSPATGDGGANP